MRKHKDQLPASWGTLYELARMDAADFHKAVLRNLIRPDLERAEAVTIVQQSRKDASGAEREKAPPTSGKQAATLAQASERGDARHAEVDATPHVDVEAQVTKLAKDVASQVKSGLTKLVGAQTAKEKACAVEKIILSATPSVNQ